MLSNVVGCFLKYQQRDTNVNLLLICQRSTLFIAISDIFRYTKIAVLLYNSFPDGKIEPLAN